MTSTGTRADTESAPNPTPRPRRSPLNSSDRCRREVERIYRAVQDGELREEQATKRAHLVWTIHRMIETGDLEKRLVALEARLGL